MIHLVLCGGIGSRLWPLSKKDHPKPFLKLFGPDQKSLFQKTLLRLGSKCEHWIVLPKNLLELAHRQAKEIGLIDDCRFFIEPEAKGTFSALSYPLNYITNPNESILVSSSDHLIEPTSNFLGDIEEANTLAKKEQIVCFGIPPREVNTGYGYIEKKEGKTGEVLKFHEKPSIDVAKDYIKKGYLWNSGIFLFTKAGLFREIKRLYPDLFDKVFNEQLELKKENYISTKAYDSFDKTSFDYAILEKSSKVFAIEASFEWSDLGSYKELSRVTGDKPHFEVGSKGNFISTIKPVVLSNVKDLIIIEKEDCIFIANSLDENDFDLIRRSVDPNLL